MDINMRPNFLLNKSALNTPKSPSPSNPNKAIFISNNNLSLPKIPQNNPVVPLGVLGFQIAKQMYNYDTFIAACKSSDAVEIEKNLKHVSFSKFEIRAGYIFIQQNTIAKALLEKYL